MAPEFLQTVPEAARQVFRSTARRVKGPSWAAHRIGELVCAIGEAAGAQVNSEARTATTADVLWAAHMERQTKRNALGQRATAKS